MHRGTQYQTPFLVRRSRSDNHRSGEDEGLRNVTRVANRAMVLQPTGYELFGWYDRIEN